MKIYMLFALSLKYWKHHKRRLITLAAVSIIGAAALCMVGLFLRSNKQIVLEKERTILGDYDAIIYEINEQSLRYVSENSGVGAYGYYRELGYTGPDKNAGYKVVSFPDERSVSMYHMPCTKGHYPENADEIVGRYTVDDRCQLVRAEFFCSVAGAPVLFAVYTFDRIGTAGL